MAVFHYQIKDENVTVEQLLRDHWQAGKKTVHEMRMTKSVKDVTGQPLDWRTPLPQGTELVFEVPHTASAYAVVSSTNLSILFEDEHIIAVLKPRGIATHPDGPGETGTLINQVLGYVKESGGDYAEHIHRLDKGTAGAILVAKHPIAKAMFDRLIEQNAITRKYMAEVDGYVKRPKGTIKLPIGRDRHHPTRRRISLTGQSAVTHFKVIERKEHTSIVEAELETGRTHQIRVHLAHLGHPVTGDTLYEGTETEDRNYRLTATSLSFVHPITTERITIDVNEK